MRDGSSAPTQANRLGDGPCTELARLPDPWRLSALLGWRALRPGVPQPGAPVRVRGIRVEPSRAAAFARVCGFPVRDEVPAGFVHVLAMPLQLWTMSRPGFGHRAIGLVHLRNTMRLLAPVRVGDVVDLTVRADPPRPHRVGVVVDLIAVATQHGEPVWTGTSSYLARGAATDPPGGPAPSAQAEGPPDPQPATPLVGRWRLPADLGRRYAAVSADANPIHLSAVTARVFGYRRALAHGMCVHARSVAALGPRLPPRHQLSVRFRRPLFLPSTVDVHVGRPADVGPGGTVIDLRQDGNTHVRTVVTSLPSDPSR